MSVVTAMHKNGYALSVCFLDEEFPGCDPLLVGKAWLSQDSTGRAIPPEDFVSWSVESDEEYARAKEELGG